jgi:hypothetical protein
MMQMAQTLAPALSAGVANKGNGAQSPMLANQQQSQFAGA